MQQRRHHAEQRSYVSTVELIDFWVCSEI